MTFKPGQNDMRRDAKTSQATPPGALRRRWLARIASQLPVWWGGLAGAGQALFPRLAGAAEPHPSTAIASGECAAPDNTWAPVHPNTVLQFAQDHGAHPCHRTEWWYVTGWLQRPDAADAGFQLTFFRSRTRHPSANPSAFAPRQLVLAHAALALPERGRLLHAERASRAGFGLAGAETGDTHTWIGAGSAAWRLQREATDGRYRARVQTAAFGFDLELTTSAPPLLQGEAGFSRKGPGTGHASHYYSRPQLKVSGDLRLGAQPASRISGAAWFDHEWSSALLTEGAVGWDWCGLNLDDGGALMAFRIRDQHGATLWRDGLMRQGEQGMVRRGLQPNFEVLRTWRSARSGAQWPVHMRIELAGRRIALQPLFDDQELDARGSTGTRYWEGAVTALEDGRRIGRGYLELTGYAGALKL